MAINGQIVDEINGLIASRDSIRSTMKAANIASDTSKLADLATNLAAAKLGATTYNVSTSNQTIPAGKLTTGAQTFRAVTTSGIDAANIKSGAVIQVGDEGSAGRIKNVTGTFTKEDNNPITAATVLSGKVGYVNGAKVTGNIATVTPSATSLNCGKSASISKGYLASDVTITANSLASQTPGTAAAGDILSDKTAWVNGSKVTGNIPTVTPSATSLNCGASATIAKGYLASAVTITAKDLASQTSGTAAAGDILSGKTAWVGGKQLTGTMPNATITSGSANITSTTYTYNSTNGNFGVTGSATISAPSVGTAGYISSSAGTRNTNTANLSATVAKIAGSTSISGTTTKAPAISKQSFTISGVADAAAAAAQTSTPTSSTYKAWVKVKSAANTGTLTATPSVSTDGYGTKDYHGIAAASATVGAAASADTYIPIKNGAYSASVSTTAGSASMSATGVLTATSSNCYITLSTKAGSATGKAAIGTAGWVATGSTSSSPTSVNVSGNGTKLYLETYTPSTITVTNSSQTLLTKDKVCTGNITIPAVNYCYTSQDTPTSTSGYNDGDIWLVVNS